MMITLFSILSSILGIIVFIGLIRILFNSDKLSGDFFSDLFLADLFMDLLEFIFDNIDFD